MAFLSKSISLLFTMACCFLLFMQLQYFDCNVGDGCFYVKASVQEMHNRKILGLKMNNIVFKHAVAGPASGGNGKNLGVNWELREAPTGPDPLHHHGGSPIKPRTP